MERTKERKPERHLTCVNDLHALNALNELNDVNDLKEWT